MEKQDAINQGLELVNRSTIAMLGTHGEDDRGRCTRSIFR